MKILLLFLPALLSAQFMSVGTVPFSASGGGGGGGVALVSNTAASDASSGAAVTTSAIDTTGANLIVIYRSSDALPTDVTDSKGNTWTALTIHGATGPSSSRLFYCLNPTVGAGHTFTAPATVSGAQAIAVAAFSGVAVSGAYHTDTGTGNAAGAATIQPGSITPSTGELLIVGAGWAIGASDSVSVNSGFTITNQRSFVGSTSYGVGLAYLIAPNTSAVNPTVTGSGASLAGMSSSMVGFLKQ